jgi:hypothetical protein
MAIYDITAPDGKTYTVEGDGTEQEALAALQQQLAPSGFAMGLRDPIDATSQLVEKGIRAISPGAADKITEANNWLAAHGANIPTLDQAGGVDKYVRDLNQMYQDARLARGDTGVDWSRLGGNLVTGAAASAPLMVAGGPAAGLGMAGRLGLGAGQGALLSALQTPATGAPDGFWKEKGVQGLAGAAFGLLGEGAGSIANAAGRRATRPDIAALRDLKVEPTIGQTIGGAASRTEEKLASAGFYGDPIRNARNRTQDQFNVASMNRAIDGIPGDVTETGQAGVAQLQDASKAAYRAAENAGGAVGVDLHVPVTSQVPGPRTATAMEQIDFLRQSMDYAPEDAQNAVVKFIDKNLLRREGAPGGLDPSAYKAMESDLNNAIARNQGAAKDGFIELKKILQGAASEQNPVYGRLKDAADVAFANRVRIENATNRATASEGVYTPGQLQMAARTTDRSVRHNQAAAGEAPMQDIANLGQRVLGNRVADSGTAPRLATLGALAVAGKLSLPALTAALAGLGGTHLLYSPAGQRAANAMLRGGASVPTGLGGLVGGVAYPELRR